MNFTIVHLPPRGLTRSRFCKCHSAKPSPPDTPIPPPLAEPCYGLLDFTVEDEESVRVRLGVREVKGATSSDLNPEVVPHVVDRELFECLKRHRECILAVGLIMNPIEAGNRIARAITEPVLVNHRDTLIKPHDREGDVQLGHRVANFHERCIARSAIYL